MSAISLGGIFAQGQEAVASEAPSAVEGKKEEAMFTMSTTAPADVAAAPADAEKSATGLASKMLKKGSGETKPVAADTVTVHYCGWTLDGKKFDSSLDRGQPTSFPLQNVIAGWTEGLQLMTEGEIRRFWIPGKLAYGDEAGGGRPSGTLVFDVELLSIKSAPKAPADVAAAPADAVKSETGLASKLLSAGKGDDKPTASSVVTVHYSGWTTDGKLFDSSVERGVPATFALNRVIPGWQEGVQLMSAGEKRRLWIPANLAYGETPPPGAPKGMLVFDVELIEFK